MADRIKVRHLEDRTVIRIPIIKNPYVIVPLSLLLLFWIFGEVNLVQRIFYTYANTIELVIAAITLGWTAAGFLIIAILYWMLFGNEVIEINRQVLSTEKPIFLYRRRRAYNVKDISRLRVGREIFKVRRNNEWKDQERVVLQFDTPYKNVTFGRGVNKEEAEFILLNIARSNFLTEEQFSPTH